MLQTNAWELSPEFCFHKNKLASAVETLNPHSRLDCGGISAIQVPQEAQRGCLPEFYLSSREFFFSEIAWELNSRAFFLHGNKLASTAKPKTPIPDSIVDGFRSLKLHKKLNVVTYPEFHLSSSCYNFTPKECMRIKSRAFFSQKRTCISSCGNPKPSFQTQLWTDFSHSSSTRSSTWFTHQNFLWDPDKNETEIRVQTAKILPRRCGRTLAKSIVCTEAQRSCEKRVKLFPHRGPSRVPIRPIFLKPESQPFKNTVIIQFLPGFHLDL